MEDGKTQLVRRASHCLYLHRMRGEADLCYAKSWEDRPERKMPLRQRQKVQKVPREIDSRPPGSILAS